MEQLVAPLGQPYTSEPPHEGAAVVRTEVANTALRLQPRGLQREAEVCRSLVLLAPAEALVHLVEGRAQECW